jgi:hypothetical protein
MQDGDFDKRLAKRGMPSHQWARNATDLEAVSRVTGAEQALSEAVDFRRGTQWAKNRDFRESAENKVRTALYDLAVAYLQCGVAVDEKAANISAGKALDFLTRQNTAKPASHPSASR